MKQTQTVQEKINCHKTLFEYLITVNVGFCIDRCSSYLAVPQIQPSIYTYLLNSLSVAEEISLPSFWTYTASQYSTMQYHCGDPIIEINGIDSNVATIALVDVDSDNVYNASLTIDLSSNQIEVGDFTVNIVASYATDPEAITVSTPLQISIKGCPNASVEFKDVESYISEYTVNLSDKETEFVSAQLPPIETSIDESCGAIYEVNVSSIGADSLGE